MNALKNFENLEKLNEDMKEKLNNINMIKNTLQNDLLALQSLLDKEKGANNALIERYNECESKKDASLIEISKLKEREANLLSENTKLQSNLNQLEKDKAKLEFHKTHLEQKVAKYEATIKNDDDLVRNEIEKRLDDEKKLRLEAEQACKILKSDLKYYKEELLKVQTSLSFELEKEKNLKLELESELKKRNALKNEIDELQVEYSNLKTTEIKMLKLNQDLIDENKRFKAEIESINKQFNDAETLKIKILQDELDETKQMCQLYRSQHIELQKENENYENEVERLDDKIDQLKKENEELSELLKQQMTRFDSETRAKLEFEQSVVALDKEIIQINQKYHSLEDRYNSLLSENEELRQNEDKLRVEMDDMRLQNEEEKQKLKNSINNEKKLTEEAVKKLLMVMQAKNPSKTLNNKNSTDLKRLEKDNKNLQARVQKERDDYARMSRSLNQEIATLKDELEKRENEISKLRSQLNTSANNTTLIPSGSGIMFNTSPNQTINQSIILSDEHKSDDDHLENWLSIPSKPNIKKHGWKKLYVVLRKGKLLFYNALRDNSQEPYMTIDLEKVYHVRAVTHTDVVRAGTRDVAKIFQLLYDIEAVSGPGCTTYLGASTETLSKKNLLTNSSDNASMISYIGSTFDQSESGIGSTRGANGSTEELGDATSVSSNESSDVSLLKYL